MYARTACCRHGQERDRHRWRLFPASVSRPTVANPGCWTSRSAPGLVHGSGWNVVQPRILRGVESGQKQVLSTVGTVRLVEGAFRPVSPLYLCVLLEQIDNGKNRSFVR